MFVDDVCFEVVVYLDDVAFIFPLKKELKIL